MDDTKHLFIEFFSEAVEDKRSSREQGRPIFKDEEFIRIRFVGDAKRELVAPAHLKTHSARDPETGDNFYISYAERFPRHYEAFRKKAEVVDGTPLRELVAISAARVAELKALNVHTIEALAKLDGPNLSRLGMGARELKNQAQAYLDKAAGMAVDMKIAAENASLRDEIERMKAEMQAFMAGGGRAEPPDTPVDEGTPFDTWADDDIKAFIKDRRGEAPRGRVSRETLVRMAAEIIEAEKEAA